MVNVKPSLNIVVTKILTDFDGLNLDRLGPERARAPTPTATTVQVGIFHPVRGNVNIDHQAKQLNFGRESGENTPNLQFSDFRRLFQFLFQICN